MGQEVQEGANSGREMAALAEVDGMDLLEIARIEVLQHG